MPILLAFRRCYWLHHVRRADTSRGRLSWRHTGIAGPWVGGVPEGLSIGLIPVIFTIGGSMSRVPIGGIPIGPQSSIEGLENLPSYTSPSKMLKLTQLGPGSRCRLRRSGSSRPAAELTAQNTRGATSSCRAADQWPIPGMEYFRTKLVAGRLRGDSSSWFLSAQRLRALRYDWQLLGMDQ